VYREYSFKSLSFPKLPECFEMICKSVKYKDIEIYKGIVPKNIEAKGSEALKELSENDFPIIIKFIKDEAEAKIVLKNISKFWTF